MAPSPDTPSILARQLQQLRLEPDQPPPHTQQWLALLDTVGRTYDDFERQISQATRDHRGNGQAWADTVREAPSLSTGDDEAAAAWSWRPGDEALEISPGMAQLLRLPPGTEALPLTVWLACLEDSDRELQCEYLMQVAQQPLAFTGQLRYTPPHGREQRWLHYELQSGGGFGNSAEGDLDGARIQCRVLDVTSRIHAEEALHGSAEQDGLTGLHNRARFFDLAANARARALRDGQQLGLLSLDVDGFRRFNEAYGHEIGDRLLRGIAQRLRSTVRLGDQLGRLAGDEFLLLVHPVDSVQHLESIAYKLQAAVAVPMDLGGEPVSVSMSVGIAVLPQDATSTLDLVRAAGRAARAAKQRGRGRCVLAEMLPPPPNPLAQVRSTAEA